MSIIFTFFEVFRADLRLVALGSGQLADNALSTHPILSDTLKDEMHAVAAKIEAELREKGVWNERTKPTPKGVVLPLKEKP